MELNLARSKQDAADIQTRFQMGMMDTRISGIYSKFDEMAEQFGHLLASQQYSQQYSKIQSPSKFNGELDLRDVECTQRTVSKRNSPNMHIDQSMINEEHEEVTENINPNKKARVCTKGENLCKNKFNNKENMKEMIQ